MEIFNAASKQIDVSTTKALDAQSTQNRPIEQSSDSSNISKDAQTKNDLDQNEIKKQLEKTVKNLNNQMQSLETNIKFGFSDEIESLYVSVLERNTGRLIRKIPSDEAMRLSEHFREIIGVIFDKKG
jgi:flagellar protein FlaG